MIEIKVGSIKLGYSKKLVEGVPKELHPLLIQAEHFADLGTIFDALVEYHGLDKTLEMWADIAELCVKQKGEH